MRGRGQAADAQPFLTGPVVPTCSHVLNKVTFSETLIQRGETFPIGPGQSTIYALIGLDSSHTTPWEGYAKLWNQTLDWLAT